MPDKNLLQPLLDCLPLHAEEGRVRDKVTTCALIERLVANGVAPQIAELAIQILQQQFVMLSLLDKIELAQGNWTFVSYPAALLGRSLLEALSTPGQAILPPDYWEQGEHRPDGVSEEQRKWLHRIETNRIRFNPFARPIRVVHVAWAIIRFGNRFLLSHREDRDRPGEKSHVLPGGRLNLHDLGEDASRPDVLRQLFSASSPLAEAHLENTLMRELDEELNLRIGEHYQCSRWQKLPTFRKVAGSGNRYGYTEYAFTLYTLKLTPEGEVHLLECEAKDPKLAWFSAEEIAAGRKADGTTAFVDVLGASWGENIVQQLNKVPESTPSRYSLSGETQMIDLPVVPESPLIIGKPGKEREIDLKLDEVESRLLLLLGWHALGFALEARPGLRRLGGGWLAMDDHDAIEIARRVLKKSEARQLPLIEIRPPCYLRLSVDPAITKINASAFAYLLEESDSASGCLTFVRYAFETPWASLPEERIILPVKANTLLILHALAEGKNPEECATRAKDWEKNLREQTKPCLQRIGLRKLWRTENKFDIQLTIAPYHDDAGPTTPSS